MRRKMKKSPAARVRVKKKKRRNLLQAQGGLSRVQVQIFVAHTVLSLPSDAYQSGFLPLRRRE